MTYSISVTGHGASADDAKEVFENLIRATRQINAAGNGPVTSGSISGTDNEGQSFSMNATEVEDTSQYETDEIEEEVEDDGTDDNN